MLRLIAVGLLVGLLVACQPNGKDAALAPAADSADRDEGAHKIHETYVRVINSNNIDELVSMFTDDVVSLAAGATPVVGKAAVRAWADDYFKAFKTHWDKSAREFVISGDYAFERYDYTSTDTPMAGGKPVVDTAWGLRRVSPRARWRLAGRT